MAFVFSEEKQQQKLKTFLAHEFPSPSKPPTHITNDVSDIPGAKTFVKNRHYINKQHFHDPNDIPGSNSKLLHPNHDRHGVMDEIKAQPVEGAQPRHKDFRTSRVINPLQPEYQLPSFTLAPPFEPRFLRDGYNIKDIDGTSAKKVHIEHPRDPMKLSDIPGSQAGWLPVNKRGLREHAPRDIINVHDIVNVDFKTKRVTDVMNPVYTINGFTTQEDPLAHPATLHPYRMNKPFFALETKDIRGANALETGKSVVGGIPNDKRKDFRPTNVIQDIPGAQADTVHYSIRSKRRVDPTNPEYTALDGSKVDTSAISTAKSIIFADYVTKREAELQSKVDNTPKPYVVASIGNIGRTSNQVETSKKASFSASARLPNESKKEMSTQSQTSRGVIIGASSERKKIEARTEEIRLVRELS
jgi:hypothetical protein